MACSKSSAPVDIPQSSTVTKCDLKCSYKFAYGDSNCNITNKEEYIELSYDASLNAKAIKYNKINMRVQEIRLYSPSIHTYRGRKADAEILIIHGGDGESLIVSVPIVVGQKTSKGGTLLDAIISQGLNKIPNLGESTTIGIADYNLDYIVPKKPFFSYTGSLPYSPCTGKYNYIVFDKIHAINIQDDSLRRLKYVIEPASYPTRDTEVFYNKLGPNANSSGGDGEIYIECNPTGSDGEVLLYQNANQDNGDYEEQFEEFLQSPIFKV